MRHTTENTKYREMNDGRTEKYDLHGIFRPGIHGDCRDPAMEHYLQPQAQQTEQTGYFRSRIPAHDPIGGDAG